MATKFSATAVRRLCLGLFVLQHSKSSTTTFASDIDSVCSPNPCVEDGASCLPYQGIPYCECSDGGFIRASFGGIDNDGTCSDSSSSFGSPLDPCDPNPCGAHVTCVPSSDEIVFDDSDVDGESVTFRIGEAMCQCPHGEFVKHDDPSDSCPETPRVEDNPCFGNVCGAQVRCEAIGDVAYCQCPDGGFVEHGTTDCVLESGIGGGSLEDAKKNKNNLCNPNPCPSKDQLCLPYNGGAMCQCKDGGFVPPDTDCDRADPSTSPCKPNPCGDEDRACIPFENEALCQCPDGGFVHLNKMCDDDDSSVSNNPCFGNTCGPDIVCKGIHGVAFCQCPDGGFIQHGDHCIEKESPKSSQDGNVCLPNPCEGKDQTCLPYNGVAMCECPDGGFVPAEESHCDTPMSPNGSDEYPCSPNPCPDGDRCFPFEGVALCDCGSGEYVEVDKGCPDKDEDEDDSYSPCDLSPCPDGVPCEEAHGVAFCSCPDSGFIRQGNSCSAQDRLNPCSPNPCAAGVKCIPMEQNAYCECGDGGFVLAENTDVCGDGLNELGTHACSPNYCPDETTTCISRGDSDTDFPLCRCEHGSYIDTSKLAASCPDLDATDNPCYGNTCGSNIHCEPINGVAHCQCPDGGYVQHGNHCAVTKKTSEIPGLDEVVPATPCAPINPCPNGQTCLPFNGIAMCECADGGYVDATAKKGCHEVLEHGFEIGGGPCSPNPCLHGESCLPLEGTALCECDDGTFGDMECPEDRDTHPCDDDPCGKDISCKGVHSEALCRCPDKGFVVHGDQGKCAVDACKNHVCPSQNNTCVIVQGHPNCVPKPSPAVAKRGAPRPRGHH